jgi:cytochrome c556
MKANADQSRIGTEMIEGRRPFDLDAARRIFATFAETGEKAPALFPETSKSGDTRAVPAIWENKADFNAKLAKLASESKAAAAATTNPDTFKAQISEVRKSCDSCHETYRRRAS